MLGAMPSALAATTESSPEPEVSWGIAPGDSSEERTSYAFEAEPGETIEDSVTIINYGVRPLELEVYAADGLTTSSGEFDVKPADESNTELGAWTEAETGGVVVGPGQSEDVNFVIDVPEDAAPGEVLGGIVTSQRSDGQGTVAVDRRLVLRVILSIAGDAVTAASIPQLEVSSGQAWNPFAPVTAEVSATVENSGNMRAQLRSVTSSAGLWGLGGTSQVNEAEEILPGGSVELGQQLRIWPTFITTVTVEAVPLSISGEVGEPASSSVRVVVIPWGALLLIALITAAVTVYLVRRRRSRNPEQQQPGEPLPAPAASGTPPARPRGPRPERS